ncbi:metal-dependent hydrolase [Burkholderia gladioli]|uniref:metal-dependent hydrolase n=1 Tax=Burkholderia gladioli TaxID=28095 RepID=UPI003132E782
MAANTMPVRRDLRFSLKVERAADWHADGAAVTHFFNAPSLMFPIGERFFMDSVRDYRDQIDYPGLKQQVLGFIGQTAMHTREHVEYNEALQVMGLPARGFERRFEKAFALMKCLTPKSMRLAMTVALEHYTAIFGAELIESWSDLDCAEESYKQLWLWHALEETEHKAVSFDVWIAVMEPGVKRYLMRIAAFLEMTISFWLATFLIHVSLIRADHLADHRVRDMWRLVRRLYGPRQGLFPRMVRPWFAFFRPGFHPW